MSKYKYVLVDVFTKQAFGGNQLAVFTDARGLSDQQMQSVAKELNLSEVTFVLPPQDPANDFRVRIFTPAVELPMAGHPTIGTAFVLARQGMLKSTGAEVVIRFEEKVGLIPVKLQFVNGLPDFIQMQQPVPPFRPRFSDYATAARMLSLDIEMLDTDLPLEVVSCGVPILFVPLKSLQAVRSVKFRQDVAESMLEQAGTQEVFVFTSETEYEGSTVHSRMFAPRIGIPEDPATGGASGPLGCYMVRYNLINPASTVKIVSEQGIEMNRPGFLYIEIDQTDTQITGVRVGGQCYFMGEGFLELSEE